MSERFFVIADRLRIDQLLHLRKDRVGRMMIKAQDTCDITSVNGCKHQVRVNQIELVYREEMPYNTTVMGISSLSDVMEGSNKGCCCRFMTGKGLGTWLKAIFALE